MTKHGVIALSLSVAVAAPLRGQVRVVNSTPECSRCRIDVIPVVRLSPGKGASTSLSRNSRVSRSADGTYYVAPLATVGVMVFDSAGNYLRTVANREGAGPGEMKGRVMTAFAANGDTIEIYDDGNLRRSLFTSRGDYISSNRIPSASLSAYLPQPDGNTAFVQRFRTPGLTGIYTHIANREGNVVKSLGSPLRGSSLSDDHLVLGRGLSAGRSPGTIWVRSGHEYAFDLYGVDGSLRQSFRRDVDWFKGIDPSIGGDAFLGLTEVGQGVWTLVGDYLGAPSPEERNTLTVDEYSRKVGDGIIEFIDVTSGRLVATRRFDGTFGGFVIQPGAKDDVLVFHRVSTPDGDIAVDILRVVLVRQQ